ncbi:MAG: CRISPR-associated helicase/endonuclease Cas3 [Acidiphilium sp. 37-60-79]|nr:MAG: CRISPR-associated helicase/endonuclease Cas3 [Acidiphilium sp. 37-60-79]
MVEALKGKRRTFIAHRREADGSIQTLAQHLRSVGRLSARNAAKFNLGAAGEVLGLLHDLGKYSIEFQNYLASATGLIDQDDDVSVDATRLRGKIDHSTAGAQLIWRKLANAGQQGQVAGQVLALCIASHHSGLIDCLGADGEDNFAKRLRKAEQNAHLDEAVAQLEHGIAERVDELVHHGNIVDDFVEIIKAIVNGESRAAGSNTIVAFKIGLLARMLFSSLIDADRVDTADFEQPRSGRLRYQGDYPAWDILIDRLEAKLRTFEDRYPIDRLRREISDHCRTAADRGRGCFTLTVPTGGGKTLASLRFALHHAKLHRLDRVIYVIPFTSIIDQNADVVRGILEPAHAGIEPCSIVLEHHSNLTPEQQTWRAKILSENWDAPVVFTTSVQLLDTLFGAGTRGARRMHQLAKSVIIFDEAQTIPLRCIHMFNNAINFLVEQCGSSVVLCTATQPLLNGVNPQKGAARFQSGDEIMPDAKHLFDALRRVEIRSSCRPGGWSDNDVAQLAAEEITAVGSCLVIVNTRKAALSLYQACAGRGDQEIYHLSTAMCPVHRRIVLAEIHQRLADNAPTLCISTQLIEAGVDVDFGAVIRHVAGLDSIAQAAGRCNRNGRQARGRVHVINPAEEGLTRLNDIRIGREKALRVLDEFAHDPAAFNADLLGPKAMNAYFRYYFFERANEMDYQVLSTGATRDETLLRLLADNHFAVDEYMQRRGSAPPNLLRQAFMTAATAFKAIDAPTRSLIVQFGPEGKELVAELCCAEHPEQQFGLLRRAQQYSINVFPYVFDKLLKIGVILEISEGVGIYYLNEAYYSNAFGLSDTPVSPMEMYFG